MNDFYASESVAQLPLIDAMKRNKKLIMIGVGVVVVLSIVVALGVYYKYYYKASDDEEDDYASDDEVSYASDDEESYEDEVVYESGSDEEQVVYDDEEVDEVESPVYINSNNPTVLGQTKVVDGNVWVSQMGKNGLKWVVNKDKVSSGSTPTSAPTSLTQTRTIDGVKWVVKVSNKGSLKWVIKGRKNKKIEGFSAFEAMNYASSR